MKTETILNNLLKVKDNPLKYMDVLENTINELKIDIYNENMGLKNRKQDPQKKALKFLNDNKKRFSGGRPCLAYACQTIINGNDVQVFTDSYIAFILKTFYKCFFNADNLKKICDILGTTELNMRLYGTLKAALIVDDKTDNQSVIVPIRSYC